MHEELKRSPYCEEQDHTKFVDYKRLEPKDIYALYDGRARDYRTILIAILAGELALLSQLAISLYEHRHAAVVVYLAVMVFLWWIARYRIAPEVNVLIEQSQKFRRTYIANRNAVPQIDTLLIGNAAPRVLNAINLRKVLREDNTPPHEWPR
ncbi:hypothetical protein QLH51_18515 [Sphingomonas sp. 2R-10]|uniref:hypothetical protein n=1 Tax=Sphingomonas sp. 2R-10 TaxID=3045148 RepID=UPI000F788DE6|nr:hypothetical protein [Sphingomonas sp. 2R-10]MDJ0278789.1 hypothetical protein [Sphingomonas sp. 2R-10]